MYNNTLSNLAASCILFMIRFMVRRSAGLSFEKVSTVISDINRHVNAENSIVFMILYHFQVYLVKVKSNLVTMKMNLVKGQMNLVKVQMNLVKVQMNLIILPLKFNGIVIKFICILTKFIFIATKLNFIFTK